MISKHCLFTGGLSFVLLTGCSAGSREARLPIPRPLGKTVPAYVAPRRPADAPLDLELPGPSDPLTLRVALSRTLLASPALASDAWEVRAAEARTLQAGLFPNPQLSVETEAIGGTGSLRRFKGSETVIALSQLLPMAGKRRKQTRLAALESDLAGWDYEARRLDVLTSTFTAFLAVLANQERHELTGELLEVADDALRAATARVDSGKVSPLDRSRAEILRSTAAIARQRAARILEASRKVLATTWGGEEPDFTRVDGDFYEIAPVPPFAALIDRVLQNPDLERWVTELEQRRAALHLERARRAPDLTLTGGFQRLRESDQEAWVVGLALPLPLFNRNQGGIREASALLSKAKQERRLAQATVRQGLAESHASLLASHREASTLRDDVLPRAEQAYQAAKTGYGLGRFNYLDVLDAQRTLFEARGQYIASLAGFHQARATVERLIGAPLSEPPIEEDLAAPPPRSRPEPALPAPSDPPDPSRVAPDGAYGALPQTFPSDPPSPDPETPEGGSR